MHNSTTRVLREAAARAKGNGRWRRTGCPLCGAGKRRDDALAVRRDGYVKCHRCGISVHLEQVSRAEQDEQEELDEIEKRRLWALAIVERSTPIAEGSPVERYLHSRRLKTPAGGWPADLRQVVTRHPSGGWWPCMLGVVRGANGRVIGCHRTFIDWRGNRAPVNPRRLSLGPIRGGAVRLGGSATAIVIGEGI